MTHEKKPENESYSLENLLAQWPDENSREFKEAREKMIAARKAGEVPTLRNFPEVERRRITAAELIAGAGQKPESTEFRTQKWDGLPENQANDGWHWLTHVITHSPTPYLWKASSGVWIGDSLLQFYPNSAWCARRQYMGRARAPTEELAEQRRKDAAGAEPVGYASRGGLEQLASGKGVNVQNIYRHPDSSWPIPLYRQPANFAALIAEAVAAERERCAKVCEERWETFADPAYAGGPIGSVSEMFACKACAAAIREGGE